MSELFALRVRLELDIFSTDLDIYEVAWGLSLDYIDHLRLILLKAILLQEVLRSRFSGTDRLTTSRLDFLEIV